MIKVVFQKISGVLLACAILASISGVLVASKVTHADYAHGDCDTNAVIRCGVAEEGELRDDYRTNQGGNVQAVYREFGINDEAAMTNMVAGRVTKSGEVWVGNEKVATGAMTAGRVNMPGSTPILSGQFFKRAPSVSFLSDSLDALVKMNDGQFAFAVINACGNPVTATPTPKPPKTPPATPPKTKKPGFEIAKDVRVKGQTKWQADIVEAKPGDEIEYRITVKNTGETELTDVILKDVLPANSVSFTNGPLQGVDGTISELVSKDGLNIGTIEAGKSKEIIFGATIGKSVDACKEAIRNVASAKPTGQNEKTNDARTKVCQPKTTTPPATTTDTPKGGGDTPQTLVETGPGAAIGIFASTSIAGVAAHQLVWARRLKFARLLQNLL